MNNPLQAIPLVAAGVEARSDARGVQLRREQAYRRGLFGSLAKRLHLHRDSRVNLDEQGSFYWRMVDGRRNLDQIAQELSRRYSLSAPDSRKAVVVFTKQLMERHLIQLQVKHQ